MEWGTPNPAKSHLNPQHPERYHPTGTDRIAIGFLSPARRGGLMTTLLVLFNQSVFKHQHPTLHLFGGRGWLAPFAARIRQPGCYPYPTLPGRVRTLPSTPGWTVFWGSQVLPHDCPASLAPWGCPDGAPRGVRHRHPGQDVPPPVLEHRLPHRPLVCIPHPSADWLRAFARILLTKSLINHFSFQSIHFFLQLHIIDSALTHFSPMTVMSLFSFSERRVFFRGPPFIVPKLIACQN